MLHNLPEEVTQLFEELRGAVNGYDNDMYIRQKAHREKVIRTARELVRRWEAENEPAEW